MIRNGPGWLKAMTKVPGIDLECKMKHGSSAEKMSGFEFVTLRYPPKKCTNLTVWFGADEFLYFSEDISAPQTRGIIIETM
jgi:hypothetical protein